MKTIKNVYTAPQIDMGGIQLGQPLPNHNLDQVGPFLLLHHYGPYEISPTHNPFQLAPHPHRGFEPITFLFQGQQFHRDSLGNEGTLNAGDVQWMTAGSGVIHDEAPSKAFVEKTGTLEGIQLWVNLPKKYKMVTPKYQYLKKEDMPFITEDDGKVQVQVVAGNYKGHQGIAETFTSVNAWVVEVDETGEAVLEIPENHETLMYLLDGNLKINEEKQLMKGLNQMVTFNHDETKINLRALKKSKVLVLSGEPINEKVTSWGPYVMNEQTEILEAMRDYQQGKMGFLY